MEHHSIETFWKIRLYHGVWKVDRFLRNDGYRVKNHKYDNFQFSLWYRSIRKNPSKKFLKNWRLWKCGLSSLFTNLQLLWNFKLASYLLRGFLNELFLKDGWQPSSAIKKLANISFWPNQWNIGFGTLKNIGKQV